MKNKQMEHNLTIFQRWFSLFNFLTANSHDSKRCLLVPHLLEHLEIFNVKIINFRWYISKSASLGLPLFILMNHFIFYSCFFISLFPGAVYIQEVAGPQAERRGMSVVVVVGGGGAA